MSQLIPARRSGQAAEPAREFEQVADRLRRMLDQTFGLGSPALLAETAAWTPLVDIEEQENAYVLEADLPGVRREDVDIEVVGNELTISGEIKEPERQGVIRRRMRAVGRFEYRVRLPEQVNSDQIEATLSDGVLRVRVPKSEQAQRRRVEVKAS
jgi:HSP20 family protein